MESTESNSTDNQHSPSDLNSEPEESNSTDNQHSPSYLETEESNSTDNQHSPSDLNSEPEESNSTDNQHSPSYLETEGSTSSWTGSSDSYLTFGIPFPATELTDEQLLDRFIYTTLDVISEFHDETKKNSKEDSKVGTHKDIFAQVYFSILLVLETKMKIKHLDNLTQTMQDVPNFSYEDCAKDILETLPELPPQFQYPSRYELVGLRHAAAHANIDYLLEASHDHKTVFLYQKDHKSYSGKLAYKCTYETLYIVCEKIRTAFLHIHKDLPAVLRSLQQVVLQVNLERARWVTSPLPGTEEKPEEKI